MYNNNLLIVYINSCLHLDTDVSHLCLLRFFLAFFCFISTYYLYGTCLAYFVVGCVLFSYSLLLNLCSLACYNLLYFASSLTDSGPQVALLCCLYCRKPIPVEEIMQSYFLLLIGIDQHCMQVNTFGRAITICSIRLWGTECRKCYRVCFSKFGL